MKRTKKLSLSRETLIQLTASDRALHHAVGGVLTENGNSVCVATCVVVCKASRSPICSVKVECIQ